MLIRVIFAPLRENFWHRLRPPAPIFIAIHERKSVLEKLLSVLTIVLPVLFALVLGWFSRRKRLLNDQAVEGIKSLVMSFMLPAVLLRAFYQTEFSGNLVLIAVCLFLCCLAGLGLGTLLTRVYKGGGKLLPFLTCGFEAGMMGYGLYAMLFPAAETHNFAMVDLGQVLFVFTVYSALLNRQKGVTGKQTLRAMVTSPVFIAIAVGVALSASGLGALLQNSAAGAPVDAVLSYIGLPTGVLMIFVVGYQLVWSKHGLKAALLTVAVRTALMAVLCAGTLLLLKLFLPVEPPLFWAVILMFTLPAPFVLPIFSNDEEQKGYVATTLSIGTLFSIALFALISVLK